jgi:hypothetical protein
MFAGSFCLALLALACAVPAAHADTLGDAYVPDYDAADGVTVAHSGKPAMSYLRFGSKASRLWKTIAGRRVEVGCQVVDPNDLRDGLSTAGYSTTSVKLPKRRSRVWLYDAARDPGLCAIASKRTKADRTCLPLSTADEKLCVRVAVATTDAARAHLDELKRAIELLVVPTIQSFAGGKDAVYAAMLANGTRAFYSTRGGVFSTNLKEFIGPNDDAFTVF